MNKNVIILLLSLVIVSCSDENSEQIKTNVRVAAISPVSPVPQTQADFDIATITKGENLYQQNCAACHGVKGEGAANWRIRKSNGKLKPPPLNGSGHTWHHSKSLLISIINNGTASQGGEMPAWRDKLTQTEINAILTWVQSTWPAETYQAWLEIDKRDYK